MDYAVAVTPFAENASPFFANPAFMRETRDLMNIDYIHNEMGITGAGVRVGVIDTGIYHAHPEFERFLDNTGRVRGWCFYDNSPANDGTSNHGTAVSGAVIAMAPGIELWHYRIGLAGAPGLCITPQIRH